MFDAAQLAILSESTVRVGSLVQFGFTPPIRLWNGSRTLVAGGYEWDGLGGLGQIDGLTESRSAQSAQVRFTLSGVSADLVAKAVSDPSDQSGKLVTVYFQLFNDDWSTLGSPILIWAGITQPLQIARQSAEDGQGPSRSISLAAENLFYGRSRPPAGLYTDRDQQQRFPGDLFFQYQHLMRSLTYVWP